jgi:Na+-translocating ferredoxin:NAD+ oxidoreductase RnfC subunit
VETVIANGCECEPLLYADQHIMQQHSDAIVQAMQVLVNATGATRGVIAIKRKYQKVVALFDQAIAGTGLELAQLDNFYPAGDEFVLVHEITGQTIPPLGLPKEVGAVVANVGALVNVSRALQNIPVIRKVVTVTGEVAQQLFTQPGINLLVVTGGKAVVAAARKSTGKRLIAAGAGNPRGADDAPVASVAGVRLRRSPGVGLDT